MNYNEIAELSLVVGDEVEITTIYGDKKVGRIDTYDYNYKEGILLNVDTPKKIEIPIGEIENIKINQRVNIKKPYFNCKEVDFEKIESFNLDIGDTIQIETKNSKWVYGLYTQHAENIIEIDVFDYEKTEFPAEKIKSIRILERKYPILYKASMSNYALLNLDPFLEIDNIMAAKPEMFETAPD